MEVRSWRLVAHCSTVSWRQRRCNSPVNEFRDAVGGFTARWNTRAVCPRWLERRAGFFAWCRPSCSGWVRRAPNRFGATSARVRPATTPVASRRVRSGDARASGHGHWGILVVDRKTGQTIYERDADQLFAPASVTKLFTTAAALVELGPNHRFQTPLVRRGEIDPARGPPRRSDPDRPGRPRHGRTHGTRRHAGFQG